VKAARPKASRRKHTPALPPAATRILTAFSDRAKRGGIRSVMMGELATELGMSVSTLYGHFPSKGHLVTAMVEHWCADLATHDALIEDERIPIAERFKTWGDAWSVRIIQYSPAFFADLVRDYPEQSATLQRDLEQRKAKGAAVLRPHLKPGLIPGAAFALLDLIYTHAHDPRLGDEVGVARRDVVRTALAIWAEGALKKHAR
jgi:AcrR family transcriptional regulator